MIDLLEAEPDQTDVPARSSRRRLVWLTALVLILAIACAGIWAWNATISRPVAAALSGEENVTMSVHRKGYVSADAIVIDLRQVSGTASMADVDRNFFKTAEALKDRRFETVVLAYRGTPKWLFDGAAFQTIGRERAFQNPVYVMRTMQRDVKNLDGTPAFPPLYGGWLGVLGQELEQHKSFHDGWWLGDAMSAIDGAAQ